MKTFPLLLTILTRGQREHGLYKELHKALYKKLYKEEEEVKLATAAHTCSTQCWSLLLGRGGSTGSQKQFLLPPLLCSYYSKNKLGKAKRSCIYKKEEGEIVHNNSHLLTHCWLFLTHIENESFGRF